MNSDKDLMIKFMKKNKIENQLFLEPSCIKIKAKIKGIFHSITYSNSGDIISMQRGFETYFIYSHRVAAVMINKLIKEQDV